MKRLVYILALFFSSTFVSAQNNCDDIQYFISPGFSVENRIEVTNQIVDRTLKICSEWDSIYFSATSSTQEELTIGRNANNTTRYLSLNTSINDNIYFIFYDINDPDSFCRERGTYVSIKFKVISKANIIASPTQVNFQQQDTLCEGTKLIYTNSENFIASSPFNGLFRDVKRKLSIVEWNTNGIFYERDTDINESTCSWISMALYENKIAPNGILESFGNSNTIVFSDVDGSANHLNYQWFYIDLKEDTEFIYNEISNAKERIIDCNNFDCIFAYETENNGKVLGLEIYDQRSGCTNLIFYDVFGLFPGLNEISVGIPEVQTSRLFNLYPNINKGSFYIKFHETPNKPSQLTIYNLLGELWSSTNLGYQTIQQFEDPNLKAGVYFAVLKQTNQAVAQQKFIIH